MFALLGLVSCRGLIQAHEEKSFLSWMRSSNQFFTGDEYQFRLGVFLSNKRLVSELNSQKKSFTVELNKFAAHTPAEYKSLLGHRSSLSAKKNQAAPIKNQNKNVDAIDWRDQNVVNPVKDQGNCGSCWAFSVIQAMESQWAIVNKELPDLSEQNLVDCVTSCLGCNGGDEYVSYEYVLNKQGGLWMNTADYPYKAVDQDCRFDASKGVCKFTKWVRPTTTQNEEELAESCVANGPISVAIDASNFSFQLYRGGVYDEKRCNPLALDHAVGLVGFGVDGEKPYWIIRNSWGPSWGEKGYIRMIRGKENQCGVATDVVLPLI